MDFKKEIKLKDLLPKRGTKVPGDTPTPPGEEKAAKPKRGISFARKAKAPGNRPKAQNGEAKPKRQKKQRSATGAKKPPRHKKLVGLKIGASQLAAARVVNNGSSELVQVARQGLDSGIIVAGELREPEALAEALKTFFRDNKLPKQAVRLGIASNRIGVRTFDIGGITDPKQLENAIRFRAQETLPIPLEEAVLDYQILGENVDEEGAKTQRVLLVVAYRDLVDRYVAACRKAGIKLVGIDLEAFALLRALGERPADAGNAAIVVVSVGSRALDARGVERRVLRVHPHHRMGRPESERRDRAGHGRHTRRGGAVKLSLSLLEPPKTCRASSPSRRPRFARRSTKSSSSSRESSSPRSSSTRASPDRSASARSSSPAAPPSYRGSTQSSDDCSAFGSASVTHSRA